VAGPGPPGSPQSSTLPQLSESGGHLGNNPRRRFDFLLLQQVRLPDGISNLAQILTRTRKTLDSSLCTFYGTIYYKNYRIVKRPRPPKIPLVFLSYPGGQRARQGVAEGIG